MLYDCDSWLAWPFCWIYYGQVITILYGFALVAFAWSIWCWGSKEVRP